MPESSYETVGTFGELLKSLRRRMQMTQQELGIALGYSTSMIARLENGERLPDPGLVKTAYIEALGLKDEPVLAARLIGLAVSVRSLSTAGELFASARTEHGPTRQPLPTPLTNLIGRDQDIANVLKRLRSTDVHLITLLGPPGVGKTRLAIEVARQAGEDFAGGVCFVALATIADPGQVVTAIAEALGLSIAQAEPLVSIKLHLRDKHLLLVLDNFEHLVEAAPILGECLAAAPALKAIATSRAALHLSGEFIVDVQSLAAPSAIELFAARAVAVQTSFGLSDENYAVVEEICRRVDSLPLAIELAAARLRLFSPLVLLARLTAAATVASEVSSHSALDVLTEGPRDLPARQRSLRNTIAWSHNLLTPSQQRMLRNMSVFAGGCSLAAVGAVAGDPETCEADLQALLDSSLVRRSDAPGGEPRYSLLEMIREYAAEQLVLCGEEELVRRRHAAYFLDFVKGSAPDLMRQADTPSRFADSTMWVRQLEREYNNFHAALDWSLGNSRDTDTGAALATWLYWIWYMRGPWVEAVYWLERALAQAENVVHTRTRARLLVSLAYFIGPVRDSMRAVEVAKEALTIFRMLEDKHETAYAIWTLAYTTLEQNNLAEARGYAEEWLALARQWEHPYFIAGVLLCLGDIAMCQKDFVRATSLLEESLSMQPGTANVQLNMLGTLACYEGNYARALALCEGALAGMRTQRWTHGIATVLNSLGDIALFQGDGILAEKRFIESLRLFSENGNEQRAVWCLSGLAAVAAIDSQAVQAVSLWSAAQAIHAAIGSPRPALRTDDYRARVDSARGRLDPREIAAAVSAGRSMTYEQAVAYALAV